MGQKKRIMMVGKPSTLFSLLHHYEEAMIPAKDKEKAKKARKGLPHQLERPYPAGKPTVYKGNVWFQSKEKAAKMEAMPAQFTLIDNTTPLPLREETYAAIKKSKKEIELIYIVLDLSDHSSLDDVFLIWDKELYDFVRSPRNVVAFLPAGKQAVVPVTEAEDMAFEVCARGFVYVQEGKPDSFKDFFTQNLVKRRNSAIAAHFGEISQPGDRPPFFNERAVRQQADNVVHSINLSFVRHNYNHSSVFEDVVLGQSDVQTGDTYTFGDLLEKYSFRSKFDEQGCEQLLIYNSAITTFEPTSIPHEFLKQLKILVLSYNQLQHLTIAGSAASPSAIGMAELRELHAWSNKIKTIDPMIGQLTHLTILDLRKNQLADLPLELFDCVNLVKLDLSDNKLVTIPPELGQLRRLRIFYACYNQLVELTAEIGALRELQELYLLNNQLRELPTNIIDLPKLRVLDVRDNPFKDLPSSIIAGGAQHVLPYLQLLDSEGTKCNRIKLMLVGQENVGKTSLLRAIQAVISSGKRTGLTMKAKKTTNASPADLTQHSGKPLSTDGIDIHKITVDSDPEEAPGGEHTGAAAATVSAEATPVPKKNEVVFSAWDFAGQEVYYTTHSFFLTERSMFIVIYSMLVGAENSRVEYWLNSIKARAPKAPIFIVATHLDAVGTSKGNEEAKSILNKYKKTFKVRGAMAVSCNTGENVVDLLDELTKAAWKEPYMGGRVPRSYFRLEARFAIERNRREKIGAAPVLDWDAICAMALQCEVIKGDSKTEDELIAQDNDLIRCLEVLHLLGSLVFFNDPAAGLTNLVILDPQWVTKVFATIITTKQNFVKEGVLIVKDLFEQVWRPFPRVLHPQLLNLLQAYEVVFRLPADTSLVQTPQQAADIITDSVMDRKMILLMQTKNRMRISSMNISMDVDLNEKLLVPALLPVTKPDLSIIWPAHDPLYNQFTRRYEFAFMPNGLFSRFMIRLLKWTHPIRYWRTGVLVGNRLNAHDKALVELDPNINRLTIFVRGKAPAEFFRVVTELLDALLQNSFKIAATQSSLCPQCIALNDPEPTIFTNEQCIEASSQGNWFLKCTKNPNEVHTVHLEQLAPDVAMVDFVGRRVDVEREVTILSELGEGAFGKVYKGEYNKEIVAVKQINLKGDDEEERRRIFNEFRREVWIMSGLQHPCVVNLKGFSLVAPFSMILEFVSCGELYKYINKKENPLNWALRLRIAWDIAKGMSFLHSTDPPLLHRDIKSPNILLAATSPDAFVVAKVADFGLTGQVFTDTMKAVKSNERAVENPTWLAPEIIREEPYNTPSDVYPYGVILWELYARAHPFEEFNYKWTTDLEKNVKAGVRPTIPADCPEEYANFIKACWHSDPKNRPSYLAILKTWLPPLIDKYAPEIKPFLARVEQAENELSSKKTAQTKATIVEKEIVQGIWVTSTDLHPETISKAERVGHQIWAITNKGTVVVVDADNGKVIDKFEKLFQPEEVVDVAVDGNILWIATRTTIKYLLTADRTLTRYPKLSGNMTTLDAKNKKKAKWVTLDEKGLQIFKDKKATTPEEEVPLTAIRVEERKDLKFQAIAVSGGKNAFSLAADSDDDHKKWLQVLSDHQANLVGNVPLKGPVPTSILEEEEGVVGLGYSNNYLWLALSNFTIVRLAAITKLAADIKAIPLKAVVSDPTAKISKAIYQTVGDHLWVAYGADILRFDKKKGTLVDVLKGHQNVIDAMVAVGAEVWSYSTNLLRVWDAETGKSLVLLIAEKPIYSMLAVGKKIYAGTSPSLEVWSCASRIVEKELEPRHETPVFKIMALDTQPPILYTVSQDKINVWK